MTRQTGIAVLLAVVAAWTAAAQEAEPVLESPAPESPAAPPPSGPEGEGAPGGSVFAAIDPEDPWIWGETAVLRGLDKVTAQIRDFEAPVGGDVGFFALTLSVKRCAKRPPEMQPETIVGMEIRDRQTDGLGNETDAALIYSGWMFGSSPGLNPLEHPVYDVWVLDCIPPVGGLEALAASSPSETGPPAPDAAVEAAPDAAEQDVPLD